LADSPISAARTINNASPMAIKAVIELRVFRIFGLINFANSVNYLFIAIPVIWNNFIPLIGG
jgi:hypothetical protein